VSVAPITWQIIAPPKARDGDSIYLVRERVEFTDEAGLCNIRRDSKPKLCRATWLKCPEISGPNADPVNGPRARADAQQWLDLYWNPGALLAVQWGFEKYGRPLIDVRTVLGESLSVWMTSERGWDVYR